MGKAKELLDSIDIKDGPDADTIRRRRAPASTTWWGWTNTPNATQFGALAATQLVEPNEAARRQQLNDMQKLIAADVPLIILYVPFSTIFYPKGGFSAWYSTPGGTPPGPPGFNNKHVFITGKQFGLPPGF